jgi:putative ABC transport system permease protein
VVRRYVGEGVRLGMIGPAIGLPPSVTALKVLLMTTGEGAPPVSVAGIAVAAGIVVITVSLAATWVPARRAASVDPAMVLRRD